MKKILIIISISLVIILAWFLFSKEESINQNQSRKEKNYFFDKDGSIILPEPKKEGGISIEQAFLERRSVREYKDEALSPGEISQILWSAQGITAPDWGGRTVPSAGALYPIEIHLVVKKAENLEPAVYHYLPDEHKIEKVLGGDVSEDLAKAARGQMFIKEAPINIVISAVFSRTTSKYGDRGVQYVHMEAGHASQNIYLQVGSLGLGTVAVGAFNDNEVKKVLNLPENETPLYIMPIGRTKE